MDVYRKSTSGTTQSLNFGPVVLDSATTPPAPYFLAGRKLYAIGMANGQIEPIGAEHVVGEMGGVWAHPVKFLDGWFLSIDDTGGQTGPLHCGEFEGHLSDVTLRFDHEPLQITRTDFVAEDDPALFALLSINNAGNDIWTGMLCFVAQLNILPAWFSGWERGGVEVFQEHGRALAYDKLWQGHWGVVLGSSTSPDEVIFGTAEHRPTAELRYKLTLQPGQQVHLEFLAACDHQRGHQGALELFGKLQGRGAELLRLKRAHYLEVALEGCTLQTPDERINGDWVLAKANLLMLEADYEPYLPGFFLAGIPEYPQLFGCDNTYTTPGATAAGFASIIRSTLGLLAEYARRGCGRVPHEVTTNGRVFNPGNTQETPQFTIAVWDYVRWTGDLPFLRMVYPICREGVLEYLPSLWGDDADGYPTGNAMVERDGMGSRKLDSACYLYKAWCALAEMARVLDLPEAVGYERRAVEWLERFERDWWLPDKGLYADSLHTDYRPQLDGHWTQVVPVQLGIARRERATHVLDFLERDFTNQWGLVHTRGHDDRVWTLPTGLMALAELQHGRTQHALTFLQNIALTAQHGMLGAFKELIPEGLCFVQLWSAGLYLQGLIEGVLGLDPRAHEHLLRIAPVLPESWPSASISNLRLGEHLLHITCTGTGCTVHHLTGPGVLRVQFRHPGIVGAHGNLRYAAHTQVHLGHHENTSCVVFDVGVGQTAQLRIVDGIGCLSYHDQHSDGDNLDAQ